MTSNLPNHLDDYIPNVFFRERNAPLTDTLVTSHSKRYLEQDSVRTSPDRVSAQRRRRITRAKRGPNKKNERTTRRRTMAAPPRRRWSRGRSERFDYTFFTCQDLDQPWRSETTKATSETDFALSPFGIVDNGAENDGRTISVVAAVVLADDQAGRPPLAEPVGGANGVPVAVPDEPAPPVRDPPQGSSSNHS